jgi:hypothetical protein
MPKKERAKTEASETSVAAINPIPRSLTPPLGSGLRMPRIMPPPGLEAPDRR